MWSAAYDALGRIEKLLVDEVAQPLRMQGQYFDPEIDLCYNRHRFFDPATCSFISRDPLGLAAGENVYAYAPNVWTWIDPLGLACKDSSKSGTGKLHVYSPEVMRQRGPHFSVETIGDNKIHTHQVIIDKARNTTMVKADDLPKPTATHTIKLSDIQASQNLQNARLNSDLGKYNVLDNSCLSNAVDVLREGGADIPKGGRALMEWAKTIFGSSS